ncbi:MAG: sugar transferase, partial [Dehalococcoidia bacterium]|nr:sugar transferase [Dehalococcoidia bacterium]
MALAHAPETDDMKAQGSDLAAAPATAARSALALLVPSGEPHVGYYATKRLIDIIGSLLGLLLLTPLFAIVTISIKLTSPGPVLHRQP